MALRTEFDAEELGFMSPSRMPVKALVAGEVGYVITGLKDVSALRVGDTLTTRKGAATDPLPGYKDVKPMVFAGLFPSDSDEYPELRDALERLKLNDAALFYEPETSQALGFGFRCGFLGLLHMEIVRERLEREFDLDLIVTAPNVAYRVLERNGDWREVHNPSEMPAELEEVEEPYIRASIIVPKEYVGTVMELNNDLPREPSLLLIVQLPHSGAGAAVDESEWINGKADAIRCFRCDCMKKSVVLGDAEGNSPVAPHFVVRLPADGEIVPHGCKRIPDPDPGRRHGE